MVEAGANGRADHRALARSMPKGPAAGPPVALVTFLPSDETRNWGGDEIRVFSRGTRARSFSPDSSQPGPLEAKFCGFRPGAPRKDHGKTKIFSGPPSNRPGPRNWDLPSGPQTRVGGKPRRQTGAAYWKPGRKGPQISTPKAGVVIIKGAREGGGARGKGKHHMEPHPTVATTSLQDIPEPNVGFGPGIAPASLAAPLEGLGNPRANLFDLVGVNQLGPPEGPFPGRPMVLPGATRGSSVDGQGGAGPSFDYMLAA